MVDGQLRGTWPGNWLGGSQMMASQLNPDTTVKTSKPLAEYIFKPKYQTAFQVRMRDPDDLEVDALWTAAI